MNRFLSTLLWFGCAAAMTVAQARVITVTTVNNTSPPVGQTSLLQALTGLQAGDEIKFNIPGDGPHFIETPDGGYPLITVNNVTIDGYSQPGSSPNTNPILGANNAVIKIVLDSRNGFSRVLDFAGDNPNDDTGYGDGESCVLGVLAATGFKVQGVSILAIPLTGPAQDVSLYGISFAKGASGQICGNWIGVAPDGTTLAGPLDGVTGFRYRVRDENNTVLQSILIDNVIVGVAPQAEDPLAQFNVILGIPAIPIIIEGNATRISGNFLGVFPSGMLDYNPAYEYPNTFEGAIEIGRAGNNTVIGVDGDGINDASERNVIGGTLSVGLGGYDHTIEFYGQTPGTNIVIAGNYIGVAVDGYTTFTNGVPALNAGGGSAQYRFGSDFDGVSDDLEANVVYNNLPVSVFPPWEFAVDPAGLNFFDELATTGIVSARGNSFVNNFPFPSSPLRLANGLPFLETYYAQALVDPTLFMPTLNSNLTTLDRLVGTVPIADTAKWPTTIIDFYAADPIGITNGMEAFIAELPYGFVQGWKYMASFVDNGPEDRDPAAGKFDIDISQIELKGPYLTVTANYSQGPATDAKAIMLTSPFADPAFVVFSPGSVESVGLRYLVRDTIINKDYLMTTQLNALGNWEPYSSVLGTSTFLIEGNTFAENSSDQQRYVVALQPADGGPMVLGEGFFSDDNRAYRGQINASRQNGNPGRVGGDKRPGATRFMVGGEASPHVFPASFNSDGRWDNGMDRGVDGRYGTVQIFSLDPSSLVQTPLTKAFDANLGRLTSGTPTSAQEISRFGGDVVCLDNGNFVVVIDDRSDQIAPFRAPTAVIVRPDGTVVKETYQIGTESDQIWANVAAYRGGFAAKFRGVIYFYDNEGTLKGSVDQDTSSGELFDRGRGDGTRIAAHINSPYVFLAGKVSTADSVKVVAWDARDQKFVAKAEVSEPAFPGNVSRVNMTADALGRVTVVWDSKPPGYSLPPGDYYHTAARVLALNGSAKSIAPLTKSFLAFFNSSHPAAKDPASLIRNWRPTVAMTTRQIMVAAKGEINSQLKPELNIDTPREVNYFVVITHPDPQDDPTPPVGGPAPTLTITQGAGNALTIGWAPASTALKLYSTPSLSAPAWTLVGTGTQNPTTVAVGAGNQFFQLRN